MWPSWRRLIGISTGSFPCKFVHGLSWKKLASRIWHGWITFIQTLSRYVFACLKMRSMLNVFFKYLNSKHPNIKITMEKETNKFLSTVNILVKNEGRMFTTSVHRTETPIGLCRQYNGFIPFSYKISFINYLIHRTFKISSFNVIFHNEINKIKNIFQKTHFLFML